MTPRRAPGSTIVPLRPREPEVSDEALLAACALGDVGSLGALFDRHHAAICRLISRLSRNDPSEVDDLAQSTFVQAWRSARSYNGRGSVRSFLFGIAANVVRQHVRSSARRRTAHTGWQPVERNDRPDTIAARNQQVARLADALAELPHDLRAVYVLCDLEDLPGVEAAEVLGLRAGTLWRKLHEARQALRNALEGGATP